MPFFVGYFLSLMRPNSNLMWHDVFVTAPLFRHIVFNAWFRSFGGTLVYFGWFSDVVWTRIFYLRPPSFWYDLPSASSIQSNSSQVLPQIGIPINTSQIALFGIVRRGHRPQSAWADIPINTSQLALFGIVRRCGRGWRQHGHIFQPHIAPRTSHLPQHITYLMSICK